MQAVSAMKPRYNQSTSTPPPPRPPRSKLRPGTDVTLSELSVETHILQEAVQMTISRHPTPTPIDTSSRHPSPTPLQVPPGLGRPIPQIPNYLPPPSPGYLLSLTRATTYAPPATPAYLPKHNPSTISRTREANLLLLRAYLILESVCYLRDLPISLCSEAAPISSTLSALDKALHLVDMASQKARETGRPNLVAKCHQFRGYVLTSMGRWREAYGDFVRAASVRRFAVDGGEEGMANMLEGCVRKMRGGIRGNGETGAWNRETVQGDGTRNVGIVEIPEPTEDLIRPAACSSRSGVSETGGRTQSTRFRTKTEQDEVKVDPGSHHTSYLPEVTQSQSANGQPLKERTISTSTTPTFYTANTLQLSATTYNTANTRPKDSPVAIRQVEEDFHRSEAWQVMDSTAGLDDIAYRASSTSPTPIHPLTPVQDFPRPFYRRNGSGSILLPPVPAPPELRQVRGKKFEGKYWLLQADEKNQAGDD